MRGKLQDIANSSDYSEVSVLFADEGISLLFSNLMESRGIKANCVKSISDLQQSEKIITEAQFYKLLPVGKQRHCLFISSTPQNTRAGICLTQPLTEEKIEWALDKFLNI